MDATRQSEKLGRDPGGWWVEPQRHPPTWKGEGIDEVRMPPPRWLSCEGVLTPSLQTPIRHRGEVNDLTSFLIAGA